MNPYLKFALGVLKLGGGWNVKNKNVKGSKHQKLIRTLKVKKITTIKDHNIERSQH